MAATRQSKFNTTTREQSIGVQIISGIKDFATPLEECLDQQMPGRSFLGLLETPWHWSQSWRRNWCEKIQREVQRSRWHLLGIQKPKFCSIQDSVLTPRQVNHSLTAYYHLTKNLTNPVIRKFVKAHSSASSNSSTCHTIGRQNYGKTALTMKLQSGNSLHHKLWQGAYHSQNYQDPSYASTIAREALGPPLLVDQNWAELGSISLHFEETRHGCPGKVS